MGVTNRNVYCKPDTSTTTSAFWVTDALDMVSMDRIQWSRGFDKCTLPKRQQYGGTICVHERTQCCPAHTNLMYCDFSGCMTPFHGTFVPAAVYRLCSCSTSPRQTEIFMIWDINHECEV